MEDTFITYDASGHPVSPAHRFFASCPTKFVGPDCSGSCGGCGGKLAKAKCKARQLSCKGGSVEGLSMPFMSDPMSCIGLLSGKDIE